MTELSPLQFEGYRDYLAVLVRHGLKAHEGEKLETLEDWGRTLGYRSPRSMGMVLAGQRLPSRDLVHRLSRLLSFSDREHRYFELLVEIERLKRRKKNINGAVLEEIKRIRGHIPKRHIMREKTFSFIAEWYHLVIRQLVGTKHFRNDPLWIKKQLRNKVSPAEIRASIKNMLGLGLIKRDAQGKLLPQDVPITTESDLASLAVRLHHRQMMTRAAEALQEQPVLAREFDSKTFNMNPRRMADAKRALRKLRDEFIREFEDAGAVNVYQFCFQFFEHTLTEENDDATTA